MLNLIKIYEISKDEDMLLQFLLKWNLVPKEGENLCPKCSGVLKLVRESDRDDGFRWRCFNKTAPYSKAKRKICGTNVEFRFGTFFSRSKLSAFQILGFVNLWVDHVALTVISKQVEISYIVSL